MGNGGGWRGRNTKHSLLKPKPEAKITSYRSIFKNKKRKIFQIFSKKPPPFILEAVFFGVVAPVGFELWLRSPAKRENQRSRHRRDYEPCDINFLKVTPPLYLLISVSRILASLRLRNDSRWISFQSVYLEVQQGYFGLLWNLILISISLVLPM